MARTPSSVRPRKTNWSVAERGRTHSTCLPTSPARPCCRRGLSPSLPAGHGITGLPLASLIVPLPVYIAIATHSRQRNFN